MQSGFSPFSKIKQNWESDLNHVFTDEEWSKALSRVHTLLHREYWTKAKLSKINPGFDPNCRQAPATLYHTFWLCPALIYFWACFISKCFILDIEPCPLVALFGLNPTDVYSSSSQSNALAFCLIITKILILLN